jgi:hypothetical protein
MDKTNHDPSVAKSFIVVEDPAKTASVGESLQFQWIPRVLDTPPRFTKLENWHLFEGMVLAVTFSNKATHRLLGSGVLVGVGLILLSKVAVGNIENYRV